MPLKVMRFFTRKRYDTTAARKMQALFRASEKLHDIVMQVLVCDAVHLNRRKALREQRAVQRRQVGRVLEVLRIALHDVEVRADAGRADAAQRDDAADVLHDVRDRGAAGLA